MPLAVTCAIIEDQGHILAVQRAAHKQQGLLWEFPGGKVEPDETAEQCIIREIQEELNILIKPRRQLSAHIHAYEWGSIELIPFICEWQEGTITLHEHKTARWVLPSALLTLEWSPADIAVVKTYLKQHQQN